MVPPVPFFERGCVQRHICVKCKLQSLATAEKPPSRWMIDAAGSRDDMAESCANRNAASRRRYTYVNTRSSVAAVLGKRVPIQRGYNRAMTKETRNMLAR